MAVSESKAKTARATRPLRALIVEDSKEDLLLLLLKLRNGGYEVSHECVQTAPALARALQGKQWDIIISDYVMPQFSGIDALGVLKKSGQDLPFIVVSGQIDQQTAVEAMRAGVHDYFNKGDLGLLVPAIERELREAEIRRQRRNAEKALQQVLSSLEARVKERTAELSFANEALQAQTFEYQEVTRSLLQSNRILQTASRIIETSPNMIALVNRDFVYTMANPAYCQAHNLECSDIVGRHVKDILGPESFEDVSRPMLDRCFGGHEALSETWHTFPVAGRRYVELHYYPLYVDEHVDQVIIVARDITERKMADEEREDLVERMRSLTEQLVVSSITTREQAEAAERRAAELDAAFSAIANGIILYGTSGEILRMNDAAAAILGYTREDASRPFAERIATLRIESLDGSPLRAEDTPTTKALRGETVQGVTLVIHPPHEQPRWVSVSGAPIRAPDGSIAGAISTFTDITFLHKLEHEREAYVHTISHDLRNPLTVIMGQASFLKRLLQKDTKSKQELQSAQFILSSAVRMNSMIQDLVDSARLESGQMRPDLKPLDLPLLVTGILDERSNLREWKRVGVELPAHLPPVYADPGLLERVLLNVLTNGLKYSGPRAKVVLRAQVADGEIVVSVSDRGVGISDDDLPHIFERFFRTHDAQKSSGVGLGLYITKLLIEAHGGRVWAESEPSKGTTFFFTLPLA